MWGIEKMSVIDIIIISSCFAFLIYIFAQRKNKVKRSKFFSCQGCMACLKAKKPCSVNKNSPENNQDC